MVAIEVLSYGSKFYEKSFICKEYLWLVIIFLLFHNVIPSNNDFVSNRIRLSESISKEKSLKSSVLLEMTYLYRWVIEIHVHVHCTSTKTDILQNDKN